MRVNATDLQNAFGKYLSLSEKEDIIIVKNGKSVAKLIRYTDQPFSTMKKRKLSINKKISYEDIKTG